MYKVIAEWVGASDETICDVVSVRYNMPNEVATIVMGENVGSKVKERYLTVKSPVQRVVLLNGEDEVIGEFKPFVDKTKYRKEVE